MKPIVHEIICQSILNRSRIPGIDYTLNPYTGCVHGCVYCYARFMIRFARHPGSWGTFCEAKVNAPEILQKQVKKLSPGLVSLSTVTDPYQYPEKQYGITRKLLQILSETDFCLSILTRSGLVLRDLDVLNRFRPDQIEVGFSIALLDDSARMVLEPNAPSIQERIDALRQVHAAGIRTWVFIAPLMPVLTTEALFELLDTLRDHTDYFLVDTLNIKAGTQTVLKHAIRSIDPSLVNEWKRIFTSSKSKSDYYTPVLRQIQNWSVRTRTEVELCK